MSLPTFTTRELLDAGVHLGHEKSRWNPRMKPYIFPREKCKFHVIDLDQTQALMHQALEAIKLSARRGRILFVGTKERAAASIRDNAKKCGQYYVDQRWRAGLLTNWTTISQSIARLDTLEILLAQQAILKETSEDASYLQALAISFPSLGEKVETFKAHLEEKEDFLAEAAASAYTKKEILDFIRDYKKLELSLGGIRSMGGLPDMMFVIDTNEEKIAIQEAQKLGIPIVAVVDSNSDPYGITYPIPGNDDATSSIELYCRAVSSAVLSGIQEAVEVSQGGPAHSSSETPPPESAQTQVFVTDQPQN